MILTSPLRKMNDILCLQEPKESCLPLHPVTLFATPTFLALGGNFPLVRSWNHGNSRIRNLSRWYATKSENMRHALLSWYSIWSIIFVNFLGESACNTQNNNKRFLLISNLTVQRSWVANLEVWGCSPGASNLCKDKSLVNRTWHWVKPSKGCQMDGKGYHEATPYRV